MKRFEIEYYSMDREMVDAENITRVETELKVAQMQDRWAHFTHYGKVLRIPNNGVKAIRER